MLAAARTIVVIDSFPRILSSLDESVRRAIRRKVKVYVQAYAPTPLVATSVVVATKAEQILARWTCEFLILVVDGEQVLFAVCRSDLSGVIRKRIGRTACFCRASSMRGSYAAPVSPVARPGRCRRSDAAKGRNACSMSNPRSANSQHPASSRCTP